MQLISPYVSEGDCRRQSGHGNNGNVRHMWSVAIVEALADLALRSSRFLMGDSVRKTTTDLAPLLVRLRHLSSYTKCALDIKRKISSELLKGEQTVISFSDFSKIQGYNLKKSARLFQVEIKSS